MPHDTHEPMDEELPPLTIERLRGLLPSVQGKDVSDDPWLYHVTSETAAEKIMEHGFRLARDRMAGRGGYAGHSEGKIFFTGRAGVYFWQSRVEDHLFDQHDDPPEVVVLRIPRSELEEWLEVDEPGTRDAREPAYCVPVVFLIGRRPKRPPTEVHDARRTPLR